MAPSGDLKLVISVLEEAVESSAATDHRMMLCDALPYAVAPMARGEAPHPYQSQMVDCVRKVLEETRLAVESARGKEAEFTRACKEQIEQAEAVEAQAAQEVEARLRELEAKAAENNRLKTALAEEEVLHARAQKDTQAAFDMKSELEAAAARARDVAAALHAPSSEESSELVVAFLGERHAEKPLIAAVPSALAAVAAPNEFDRLVIQEVAKIVEASRAEAEEQVAKNAQDAACAQAERMGAWAILDVTRDNLLTAEESMSEAEVALTRAQSALQACKRTVDKTKRALSDKLSEDILAEQKLAHIASAAAALERLVAPPPPEPPVDVEDEPMLAE